MYLYTYMYDVYGLYIFGLRVKPPPCLPLLSTSQGFSIGEGNKSYEQTERKTSTCSGFKALRSPHVIKPSFS